MAKKRPKQPKIVKKIAVFRLSVNEQPIKIENITNNQKPNIRRNEIKQQNKCSNVQLAAPQNYNQLKSRFSENVDLQNGYPPRRPEERERSKFNTKFLTTSTRKENIDFLKFCLYVEKIDFECGPSQPKMTKIGTFAEN